MIKIPITALLAVLSTSAFAQYSYHEVLFLPWGNGTLEAGLRLTPEGRLGPMSFAVRNDTTIVLDSQNRRVSIFCNDSLLRQIPTPWHYIDDFIFKNPDHYFLLANNALSEFIGDKLSNTYTPDSPRTLITALVVNDSNEEYVVLNETHSVKLTTGQPLQAVSAHHGILDGKGTFVRVIKNERHAIAITRTDDVSFEIHSQGLKLGAARFLGSTPGGHLYICLEKIITEMPLEVEREISLYDTDGSAVATFQLPSHAYTYIFKEFCVDKDGNLYHMLSTEAGIHIVAWHRGAGSFQNRLIYTYPAKFDTYRHDDELHETEQHSTPPEKSGSGEKEAEAVIASLLSVTRDESLGIGNSYVAHQWTATADNLTFGRILDPTGVEIETPPWVQIGTNYKIPYKWGGFNTLPEFDQGLLDGKYAGDIATTGVSSYCVGVDCSGFVSRCWKLSSHYSTRMMDDYITVAYSSWDQLKPADAVHKPGHVRLFVDFNPNGSLFVVEASGVDWRVSYRNYYLNDLATYTPRYYRYMEGTPGSIPKPELVYLCFEDSVRAAWWIDNPASIGGFHLYQSSSSEEWIPLLNGQTVDPRRSSLTLETVTNEPLFYKVLSVSSAIDSTESYPSDTYGYYKTLTPDKVLIVDGFDRTSGSYPYPYHTFAKTLGKALAYCGCSFESSSNDALLSGAVSLTNYQAVAWLLGDESTADETFSSVEQNLIVEYLQQGGKLFISGSEIAWDLDYRGSTDDKYFMHRYLRTAYDRDDAGSYEVHGAPGTAFAGTILHYDDGTKGVYEEDYPDAFQLANGSCAALIYANGLIAATAFEDTVPGGTGAAKVVVMGFPFETVYDESERIELIANVLDFFDLTSEVMAETPHETPRTFQLLGNYPNPFTQTTSISYRLFHSVDVELTIFDLLGRRVHTLRRESQSAGEHTILWDGRNEHGEYLPSGMYAYRIQIGAAVGNGKLVVVR